ncbi:MAG: mechanosensitive ion channel domain-containing protein [Planctomycetota bacterium]|jgi:potassium efflux system protein
MHVIPRWLIVLVFFMLAAQGMALPQEPKQEEPAATETITTEQIDAKIQEIEASRSIEEALKTEILEAYNQALSFLKDNQSFGTQTETHRLEIKDAPAETADIRNRLKAAREQPPPVLDTADLANISILDLESLLSQEKVTLTQKKAVLDDLKKRIKTDQDLPAVARQRQIDVKNALKEAEKNLKAPLPQGESPLLSEARRMLLEASVLAHAAEINMLEQALLSRKVRLDLLTARQEEIQLEMTQAENRVMQLEEFINERRIAEAEEASEEAKKAVEEAEDMHPILGELARENEELSEEWVELESWIQELTLERQSVEDEFLEMKEELDTVRNRLTQMGFSETLGQDYLRDQHQDLESELHAQQLASDKGKKKIYEIRLRRWKAHDRYKLLANLEEAVDRVLMEKVPPANHDRLKPEILSQLTTQRKLLKELDDAYDKSYSNMITLDTRRKELEVKIASFRNFLDERLLWIPSTFFIGSQTLKDFRRSLEWFLDADSWANSMQLVIDRAKQVPKLTALVTLVIALILIFRRKMLRRLATIAEQVGNVYVDRFAYTLEALVYTILLALPLPLVLGYTYWLIANTAKAPDFTMALGHGLFYATILLMVMLFLFSLSRKRGIAGMHFKWSESTKTVLRRHMIWFTLTVTPISIIIRMTEFQEEAAFRTSLGRVVLVIGLIVMAVFFQRILRTRGGITENHLATYPDGWLARLRFLWYPAAVGIPAMLALLSIYGYNYTARELNLRFARSIAVILCIVLLRDLILRWLRVAQRKLKLARIQQEREAARAGGEEEPDPGEIDLSAYPEGTDPDLDAIDEQSRRLIRTAVAVSIMLGLWFAWAEVLPALGFLVDVELWQHTVVQPDGTSIDEAITLAHLILALLSIILAVVAARNLPGLMEITVLQRLPMDKGSRFAVSTITSYVILAVGIVIGFKFIGVGWGQVQWLVAALGVGLGFGLQEIVANFICGLIILFERPIRVGDTVTIGNVDGTVSRIQIRATTIIGWDRKELIVPNKTFITENMVNWTLSDPVLRILVRLGVAHGSDTVLVKKLLTDAIDSCEAVLDDPRPRVDFVEYGESSLDFEIRVYVKGTSDLLNTKDKLHMTIEKLFREHGIRISFPQRDIHVRSMVETVKADDDKKTDMEGE